MAQTKEITSFSRIEYDHEKNDRVLKNGKTDTLDDIPIDNINTKWSGMAGFKAYLKDNHAEVIKRVYAWENIQTIRVYPSPTGTGYSFEFTTYQNPKKLAQEAAKKDALALAETTKAQAPTPTPVKPQPQQKPVRVRRETFLKARPSNAAFEAAFRQRREQAKEDFRAKVKVDHKSTTTKGKTDGSKPG